MSSGIGGRSGVHSRLLESWKDITEARDAEISCYARSGFFCSLYLQSSRVNVTTMLLRIREVVKL